MVEVYLDHHATTPCAPEVVEAMLPLFAEQFGNPASRSHHWGQAARSATETARQRVAALIGAQSKELVFTSGATEADNLACLGVARAAPADRRELVTVQTEHKAVLEPLRHLAEHEGFTLTELPVGPDGRVELEAARAAITERTALVSVMLVNNEIGTVQPVAELAALAAAAGAVMHCDAAQAPGMVPVDVRALGVDLLSLSAHKFYGPMGVGALFVKRRLPRLALTPLMFGGGHERGLRPGTLALPLVVGLGVAAELAREALSQGVPARVRALRERLWAGLSAIPEVLRNSPSEGAPHNLSVSFMGVDAAALLLAHREIGLSSGSACTSAELAPSHVLRALGLTAERAHASLRFGLGRNTTEAEIDYVIRRFQESVPRLREAERRL